MATKQDLIYGHPRHRAAWQRQYQCVPRWARLLAIATIATFGLLGLFHGIREVHDTGLKNYATDFGILGEEASHALPQHPIRSIRNRRHIDEQYHYLRHLGQGAEGSAAVYIDASNGDKVVIKTFSNIARNKIPELLMLSDFESFTNTWPTEIEAGLLLGETPAKKSYVPVLDYFILQNEGHWSWALVMPFVSNGTLLSLASHERRREESNAGYLDQTYRSAFNDMLAALATLHAANLCHDDIKPDNILIDTSDHWLLGDLGGIRHTSHPWHATATWQIQNQWPDCQLNDIRRALKSYLWFLREASADKTSFDRQFWTRTTAWSRMYWSYVGKPVGIHEALDLSRWRFAAHTAEQQSAGSSPEWSVQRKSKAELSRATAAEIICTTVPRRLFKHWWSWIV